MRAYYFEVFFTSNLQNIEKVLILFGFRINWKRVKFQLLNEIIDNYYIIIWLFVPKSVVCTMYKLLKLASQNFFHRFSFG